MPKVNVLFNSYISLVFILHFPDFNFLLHAWIIYQLWPIYMTNIIMKIKIIDPNIMLDVSMKVTVNFVMMKMTIYFWITKNLYFKSSRILTENSLTYLWVNVCKCFVLYKELLCEISLFLHAVVEAFCLLGGYAA